MPTTSPTSEILARLAEQHLGVEVELGDGRGRPVHGLTVYPLRHDVNLFRHDLENRSGATGRDGVPDLLKLLCFLA